MDAQELQQAQDKGQIEEVVKAPVVTPPPPAIAPKFEDYLVELEWLRRNMENPIIAKVRPASGQQAASTVATKINLDTVIFASKGITVDTANNKIVIESAGKYLIIGQLYLQNPIANNSYEADIYKNGSVAIIGKDIPAGALNVTVRAVDVLDLAVGDYIELYVYQQAGSNVNVYGGNEYYTHLLITKLRI